MLSLTEFKLLAIASSLFNLTIVVWDDTGEKSAIFLILG